jgi:hypothetical protein
LQAKLVAQIIFLLHHLRMTKKSTTTKRDQPGGYSVQFKDQEFRARLQAQAKSQGLCVATLIRHYTIDGVQIDERKAALGK